MQTSMVVREVSAYFILVDIFFFSVIKGCLSTVPEIFVQCYKRAAIGDHAWLTGPTLSSTRCTEIKLVSKETSSSCEVHCFHAARSRIQVFSNIEGTSWDLFLQNSIAKLSAAGRSCGCQMVRGLDTGLSGLVTSPGQYHHFSSVLAYTMPLSTHRYIKFNAGGNPVMDIVFIRHSHTVCRLKDFFFNFILFRRFSKIQNASYPSQRCLQMMCPPYWPTGSTLRKGPSKTISWWSSKMPLNSAPFLCSWRSPTTRRACGGHILRSVRLV